MGKLKQTPKPLFSVIIPAHNEQETIGKAIESICVQTEKNFEIIVVDDGSTDNTSKVIESYRKKEPRLRLVISSKNGSSAAQARNLGASWAAGKYLLFHDADCIADACLLNNAAKCFDDYDVDGIATKTLNTKPKNWIQRAVAAQRTIRWEYSQSKMMYIDGNSGINVAIMRRDAFELLGGFDEKIFYFEDNDLTKRFFEADYSAMFDPSVIQYHEDPLTLKESLGQCKSIAKGLTKKKNWTTREKITINFSLIFVVCLFGGLLTPILLTIPLTAFVFIFTGMSIKSKDVVGSFYFSILYFIRSIAKMWYYFKV